ncbi:histidine kinase [Phreatobacter aquaticus]|uniref:Histidine kinase n=1 Tax=Phreatobacter aquaticus TaxID=2570229 RepID=A0A4D7QGR2_9HYPH|nr:histidine kinase [Phreatobacter aquaticus]QCK85019.1 histidine kinase [Phreatobacter aquaticus]
MPTLMRFVVIAAVLGGLGFTAMVGLAYFVEPDPREMSVSIPANRLQPRR